MSRVYYVYDERMELHVDLDEETRENQFERPERTVLIHDKLMKLQDRIHHSRSVNDNDNDNGNVNDNGNGIGGDEMNDDNHSYTYTYTYTHSQKKPFISLECQIADRRMIELTHSPEFYDALEETSHMTNEELKALPTIDTNCEKENEGENNDNDNDNDMYFSRDTFQAALLACGGVAGCVDAVTNTDINEDRSANANHNNAVESKRALAVVRPPGHHACKHSVGGFCFFNSVVVAAKHAIDTGRAKKVVIIDWDIHHGDGSSELTYEDPNILYISLHRYGPYYGEDFFPGTGRHDEIGGRVCPNAIGSNINIAWTKGQMGNVEYAAAMCQLILPLLSAYDPDLVLISCGLDAAEGDLIGDCSLYPNMYHAMTRGIIDTIGERTPIVVALEGGYNLDINACCMEAVALALLDEAWDEDGLLLRIGDGDGDETKVANCIQQIMDMPQDRNLSSEATRRLRMGQQCFQSMWDMTASDSKQRGKIKRSAVQDINRTIRSIRDTVFWTERGVTLETIPHQKIVPKNLNMKTRMTRSRSKKKEVVEDLVEDSPADLGLALENLHL